MIIEIKKENVTQVSASVNNVECFLRGIHIEEPFDVYVDGELYSYTQKPELCEEERDVEDFLVWQIFN